MSERTVQVLVRAAELIHSKGFDATTVNDICEATGLTKGGLYHYIQGKRDLLYQIMRLAMASIETNVAEVKEISDPEEQLRAVVRAHISGIARGHGVLTALAEEVEALEPEHRGEILKLKRQYFDFVRGILERMQNRGRLADANLSVATFNLLGAVLFFARWYRDGGGMSPAEVADAIVDQTLYGLVKR
jgi:AcrR family transcriptional regulator